MHTPEGPLNALPASAAVYGAPLPELAEVLPGAVQVSPLALGAEPLEALASGSIQAFTVLGPPGTEERRAVLAHILRALASGGRLTALAPKDRGGARLGKELAAFGCVVTETARRHHRICLTTRPETPTGLEAAIEEGAPRLIDGLWTQPGVFSWKRPDPGSLLLAAHVQGLVGRGADLGCGIGVLSRAVLVSPKVERLTLVDLDRRAVECARRNVVDPRAQVAWADALSPGATPADLDFVVMNPPFHLEGNENRALGQAFIKRAHGALRRSGILHLVANRHLPYEAVLGELFNEVQPIADQGGYKVLQARRR